MRSSILPNRLGGFGVSSVVNHAASGMTAMVALCLLAAGCAAASSSAPTATTASTTSSAPTVSTESPPRSPAEARPCVAANLAVTSDLAEAAGSAQLVLGYDFRNKTHVDCALRGYPRFVIAAEPGLPSVLARHTRFKQDLPGGNVAPGKAGILVVYAPLCRRDPRATTTLRQHVYHHLVVSLPGGGKLDVSVALDLSCGGFSIDPFGVRQASSSP